MANAMIVRDRLSERDIQHLRADGFRLVTLCLPDTSNAEFRAEYRRQMAEVARHDRESNFADSIEPQEDDLLGWI